MGARVRSRVRPVCPYTQFPARTNTQVLGFMPPPAHGDVEAWLCEHDPVCGGRDVPHNSDTVVLRPLHVLGRLHNVVVSEGDEDTALVQSMGTAGTDHIGYIMSQRPFR